MSFINDIGWAVDRLWAGARVRRAGWNGKGMWIVLVRGADDVELRPGTPYHAALNVDDVRTHVSIGSHIDMYTAAGTMQPGWLASQADLLATDWELA